MWILNENTENHILVKVIAEHPLTLEMQKCCQLMKTKLCLKN